MWNVTWVNKLWRFLKFGKLLEFQEIVPLVLYFEFLHIKVLQNELALKYPGIVLGSSTDFFSQNTSSTYLIKKFFLSCIRKKLRVLFRISNASLRFCIYICYLSLNISKLITKKYSAEFKWNFSPYSFLEYINLFNGFEKYLDETLEDFLKEFLMHF